MQKEGFFENQDGPDNFVDEFHESGQVDNFYPPVAQDEKDYSVFLESNSLTDQDISQHIQKQTLHIQVDHSP
jgi:hypothetical protein